MTSAVLPPQTIAVVTGGAMGIGAAVVHHMATAGHAVIIADRDTQAAQQTAHVLVDKGCVVSVVGMDVGLPESIAAGFEDIQQRAGRCDILVNSAGVATVSPFLDRSEEHTSELQSH